MSTKSAADDVRDVSFYDREYQNWMGELRRAQDGVARWINSVADDLETLLRDPEQSQNWQRISELQALLSRMYNENPDLPGLKAMPRLDTKRKTNGAHGVYR